MSIITKAEAYKARSRAIQEANDIARGYVPPVKARRKARTNRFNARRPAHGSQEWAETRGDDLGESPDY